MHLYAGFWPAAVLQQLLDVPGVGAWLMPIYQPLTNAALQMQSMVGALASVSDTVQSYRMQCRAVS